MEPYTRGQLMAMSPCRFSALLAAANAKFLHYEARERTTISEQAEIAAFETIYKRILTERDRRGL